MIDQAKLDALSVPVLIQLRDSIKWTIERKQRQALRVGEQATFFSRKKGREVRIQLTHFGPKNAYGVEVAADGTLMHLREWRVPPALLTPAPRLARRDEPRSAMAGAF